MNTDQLLEQAEERPVVVQLSAQEIGKLYSSKVSPDDFRQYLLERFRAAGVRVEGTLYLRLAHGEIARFKTEQVKGVFSYCWLPEQYAYALHMQKQGGLYV